MRTNEQEPSENSSKEKKKYPGRGNVLGAKNEWALRRRVVDCAESGEKEAKSL